MERQNTIASMSWDEMLTLQQQLRPSNECVDPTHIVRPAAAAAIAIVRGVGWVAAGDEVLLSKVEG